MTYFNNSIILFVFSIVLVSCGAKDFEEDKAPTVFSQPSTPTVVSPPDNTDTNKYFHASGTQILDPNDTPFYLQGVAFGNQVWNGGQVPTTHHNEADYARLASMNMNAVRFYLNYKTFEDDSNPYTYKQSGWDWIDQNITWAKNHGVYLILNMHYPQGGYQSLGEGDALWTSNSNQDRLAKLWSAIALKYKTETQIVGFGILNEPVPINTLSEWKDLAQNITNEIRSVNNNHIIFVEKPIYIKNNPEEDNNLNFPIINDDNLVYEFHFYEPIRYSHQLFDWSGFGNGGAYPDQNTIVSSNTAWYTAIFNNPTINSGSSDWTYYEGIKYKIDDTNIKIGSPALVGSNVNGRVYFDNIIVKEYDENQIFIRDIITSNLDTYDGWTYWSENESGNVGQSNNGQNDNSSIYIESATADCNISNYLSLFETTQGYYYQISGWMKGENISATANCKLRIDFSSSDDPIFKQDKPYLEFQLNKYKQFSNTINAPIYLGEFGVGKYCFEDNKGGVEYVNDVLDIILNDIPFTYHSYHENAFGIFYGDNTLPNENNANTPLINLFNSKL